MVNVVCLWNKDFSSSWQGTLGLPLASWFSSKMSAWKLLQQKWNDIGKVIKNIVQLFRWHSMQCITDCFWELSSILLYFLLCSTYWGFFPYAFYASWSDMLIIVSFILGIYFSAFHDRIICSSPGVGSIHTCCHQYNRGH